MSVNDLYRRIADNPSFFSTINLDTNNIRNHAEIRRRRTDEHRL
jgi:hypothetical protein